MTADPFDVDAWAKEDCACGHARFQHDRQGRCNRTRTQRVRPHDLPDPIYLPGEVDDPFAWPTNWPDFDTWPNGEVPCCGGFYDAGLALAEAREPE